MSLYVKDCICPLIYHADVPEGFVFFFPSIPLTKIQRSYLQSFQKEIFGTNQKEKEGEEGVSVWVPQWKYTKQDLSLV